VYCDCITLNVQPFLSRVNTTYSLHSDGSAILLIYKYKCKYIYILYIQTGAKKSESCLNLDSICNVRSLHLEVQSLRKIKYPDIKTKIIRSFLLITYEYERNRSVYIYEAQSNILWAKFVFHKSLNF
jgi:hypothetical protein